MSLSYNLDANDAREGDNGGNNRIDQSGAYIGVITMAKAIVSTKNTLGIEMTFKSDTGQEANYLQLWTQNAQGEKIYGAKVLNALMACLKTRSIAPVKAQIMEYDHTVQNEVPVTADTYPELMNKRIGIVLQREEYLNKLGEVKSKFNIFSCFDAETRQTATEILDKSKAERLDKLLAHLKDKTLTKPTIQQPSQSIDDFDDDIPF